MLIEAPRRTGRPPTYLKRVESLLQSRPIAGLETIDLFCGCGGLSLGFEAAGFTTHGFDGLSDAIATHKTNLHGTANKVWLDSNFSCPRSQVIIGGPPCQPFSEIGLRKGLHDKRDGFPIFIRAVAEVRPKIWMFENVPGMTRHTEYFDSLVRTFKRVGYKVEARVLDASMFGVPQKRRRLVVVGWKRGIFRWPVSEFPPATVSDAIGRLMNGASTNSRFLTPSMANYIARYERASNCSNPRDLNPNNPARTVTCRNLAGATGDMLRIALPDGRRRMLTVREAARLQSFPDWFRFTGTEGSQFTQIGNAVPPLLAYQIGAAIRSFLD